MFPGPAARAAGAVALRNACAKPAAIVCARDAMGFASGSVSFRRFAVVGESPMAVDQGLLDKLGENALEGGGFGAEEVEYGWSGGRHLLDGSFAFEHNVFADALHFALR